MGKWQQVVAGVFRPAGVVALLALCAALLAACGPGPEDRAETRQIVQDALEASESRMERHFQKALTEAEERQQARTAVAIREAETRVLEALQPMVELAVQQALEDALYDLEYFYSAQPNSLSLEALAYVFDIVAEMMQYSLEYNLPYWDGFGECYAGECYE